MSTPQDTPAPIAVAGASGAFEVLVLRVGVDSDAVQLTIPAEHVREVARVERVTEYPGAPADVSGITAVRGQIVPVLDLTPRSSDSPSVVLLSAGARALALAGGTPIRIARAVVAQSLQAPQVRPPRLWSGRALPIAGAVRLLDASRPDAADGPALPLLDVAALIGEAVDDSGGEP